MECDTQRRAARWRGFTRALQYLSAPAGRLCRDSSHTGIHPRETQGIQPCLLQVKIGGPARPRRGDRAQARELRARQRSLPSSDPNDPGYRRLRYVRYADDSVPRTLKEASM
jgi:hypothetical protein